MTYKVELVHTHEGYSVACPDLPGCWSEGETEEEAIANIKSAITEYLSVAAESGNDEVVSKKVRYVDVPVKAELQPAERFVVKPIPHGLRQDVNYDKISLLLEQLEGPMHL